MISEGGYGCIYYPELETKDEKFISKVQLNHFTSRNEKKVSDELRKIPNFQNFFGTVEKIMPLNINKLDPKLKAACTIMKKYNSKEFRVFKMEYIGEHTYLEYLEKSQSNENLFPYIFETYKRILIGIQLLLSKNIIHMDLKGNNIMFNSIKNIPIIIDFGLSVRLEVLDKHLEDYFYTFAPEYYYWSLEIHYINYLVNETPTPTAENIIEICALFVEKNKILQESFSQTFLEKYKLQAEQSLLRFLGKEKSDVIEHILKFSHTWDNYALSMVFIKIIKLFNLKGFVKNNFMIHFAKILLTNIHPYMERRLSPSETYKKFASFFYNKEINTVQNFQELLENLIETSDMMKLAIQDEKDELKRLEQILS